LRSGRANRSLSVLAVDEVPVVLEVEPLGGLAVLLLGAPLDGAAVFWAVVIGLDELVLLLLAVFSALLAAGMGAALAGGLGGALELLESVLVCAYARPITVTAAAAAIDETMDLLELMVVLLS
jgi:hypothetical protein